jgi:6-phosphogluconolactonase (cycloisomerase 2 family)
MPVDHQRERLADILSLRQGSADDYHERAAPPMLVKRVTRIVAASVGTLALFLSGAAAGQPGGLYAEVSGSPVASGASPYGVEFSPSGAFVAAANYAGCTDTLTCGTPGDVAVYSVAPASGSLTEVTGSPVATGRGPSALAFSPDGSLLATANLADGTVSVFSMASTGSLTEVGGSPFPTGNEPYAIAFSPSGAYLATANFYDGTVSVFAVNGTTGALAEVRGSPFQTGSQPRSVAFSPGGSLLATANGDGTVSVFSFEAGTGALTQVPGSPFEAGASPRAVSFSPSGGLLAVADFGDGTISMFSVNPSTGALTQVAGSPFQTGGSNPDAVTFSATGGLLGAVDYGSDEAAVFDVNEATGALSPVIGSPYAVGSHPHSVAFSPTGQMFATANAGDGTLSVFIVDLPTLTLRYPHNNQTFAVGQHVVAQYTCVDSPYGPGISHCGGGSGVLDTRSPGTRTFSVTATSLDGLSTTVSVVYRVVLRAPRSLSPPTIRGPGRAGALLHCLHGGWTGAPGRFAYAWTRFGRSIAGAAEATYRVTPSDQATEVACRVTAWNALGRASASSRPVIVLEGDGCPDAAPALAGDMLGRIRLGMTRAQAQAAYLGVKVRSGRDTDSFCLRPAGLEVGYPSAKLLALLSAAMRSRLHGRVIWAATANPHARLGALRPGSKLSKQLHAASVTLGSDHWYFARGGRATMVIDVRGGVVRALGIAAPQLTGGSAAERELVRSFG